MKEKTYIHLSFSRCRLADGGFQNKIVLESLGENTGCVYYRALFINGNFQYSDFYVPMRGFSREDFAIRLLKKTLKRMA